MAGTGAGEARLILEAGSSRFVVRSLTIGKATTAEKLLNALPSLTKSMQEQLERVRERETKK